MYIYILVYIYIYINGFWVVFSGEPRANQLWFARGEPLYMVCPRQTVLYGLPEKTTRNPPSIYTYMIHPRRTVLYDSPQGNRIIWFA